ncbi:diadenylate cyclase CdaA [Vallitalea okinawensis]|uniref:diadenylate cyclase CdaA n=1 Tax=Vallitalea okinawensis TaxID=2078660 RepID=UPI002E8E068F|nr:diadenylate cyclase CdaA [Vallitalea okinawensis]
MNVLLNVTQQITQQITPDVGMDISYFKIPSITLGDILDILIVAFLIYKIIMWIKDTRAWVLFKGIMFILIMFFSASVFQLHTISWIFRSTINVGIIAFIVVFQPELRRALEQLGRGNIMSTIFSNEMIRTVDESLSEAAIDEIIAAAKNMSREKTGALIVIEQAVGLSEYERTGIPIDSKISSQLIENIFEHNTPLHDGAIIIRHGRIKAATCFLPLSDNPNISFQLGTRHRAALGLSEVSDSKIIVVSEETGTISMAYDGKLTRNINEEFIKRHLLTEGKKKEGIKIPLWKGRKKNEE